MPRMIEPPDEYVATTIAVEDNERSQRSIDLPGPEPFRPQASPVDLSRGVPGSSKLAMLQGISQILESAVGTSRQGLQYFGALQERTQEQERDEVGLAMREAEVINAAPPGPIRRFFQGANPFIGQGRNEQFGENTYVRAASAFETVLIAERQRRAELRAQGQDVPTIETPEEVLAFAQDYFDLEMLNHELGRDPHFQRGFQENVREGLSAIIQREEVSRRDRIVAEANEAGVQLSDNLITAQWDDPTDSLSPNAISEGLRTWVQTNAEIGLGSRQELTRLVVSAAGASLLDKARHGEWRDILPDDLSRIHSELMAVAGDDLASQKRITQDLATAKRIIDEKQTAQATIDDDADAIRAEELRGLIYQAARQNDRDALAQYTAELGEVDTAQEAVKVRTAALEAARVTGVTTANSVADARLRTKIDSEGLSVAELERERAGYAKLGIFFTADELRDQDILQGRSKERGKVRKDPAFKEALRYVDEEIKLAGINPDQFEALFDEGTATVGQRDKLEAFQEIRQSFTRSLMSFAESYEGGPEAAFSSPAWEEAVRREKAFAIENIRKAAPSPPDGTPAEEARAVTRALKSVLRSDEMSAIPIERKIEAAVAVGTLERNERIIKAYPEDGPTDSVFLNAQIALHLDGVVDAETEYLRQRETLEAQLESLQTALRQVASNTNQDTAPREQVGNQNAARIISDRIAALEDALGGIDTSLADLKASREGDPDVALRE